jgi:ABC-type arginine transport system ATPase subunit
LISIIKALQNQGIGIIIATQDAPFAVKVFGSAIFLEEGEVIESTSDFKEIGPKLKQFLMI